MRFPFFPGIERYQPDQHEGQPRRRSPDSSLIKDFLTVPIALPIWLWNLTVIAMYLAFLYFAVHIGLAFIAWIILFVARLW